MALRMWQSAACQQPLQSLLAQWQQPITTSCLLQADAAPQAANTSEQAESPIEATRTSTNASQAEHNCAMHQLRQEWKLRFQRRAESMRQQQTAQQAKQEHEQARSRERKAVRRSLKQQIAAEQQRLHSERLVGLVAWWRHAKRGIAAGQQRQGIDCKWGVLSIQTACCWGLASRVVFHEALRLLRSSRACTPLEHCLRQPLLQRPLLPACCDTLLDLLPCRQQRLLQLLSGGRLRTLCMQPCSIRGELWRLQQ